jgi:hypothetical protein
VGSWSYKATWQLNTIWPYVIAGVGSLFSAITLGDKLVWAGLIGVPSGVACVLVARGRAEVTFDPEPQTEADLVRQYIYSKLFCGLFGIAFPAAAYFAPDEVFSGGAPGRALMMFLGGMSLGIAAALPMRPKDHPQ